MDTDPWEEHIVHELDLCLLRFVGLIAQALAAGHNHLTARLEQQSLLNPNIRPARRRIRGKQPRPPAYENVPSAIDPPPAPVAPRMCARNWLSREHSNREGARFSWMYTPVHHEKRPRAPCYFVIREAG